MRGPVSIPGANLVVFALCLIVAFAPPAPALTQTDQGIEGLDLRKRETEIELAALREKIGLSQVRKAELDAEISGLEADRVTINRNMIDTSARSRGLEERIERSANRLDELRREEEALRGSLNERRGVLMEVIAALQRLGINPPPALLVKPEDALSSIRSAILLGAVIPEIRAQTGILLAELKELVGIREDIGKSRAALSTDLGKLAEEEERLTLLLEEKRQLSNTARAELARETALAAELAGKAGNLQGLIEQLESEIGVARQAAEAARQAEEKRRLAEERRVAEARQAVEQPDFSDMARIAPAMAFSKAKGLLPKPVVGVELVSFNQRTETGSRSQGITIATRTGSIVNSPADGWIIYSGPFRSYGQLLIINAGDGYHVVMAGMERIDVALGQFVLTGEPVGAMGSRRIASTTDVDVGSLRPVLYLELRKDGTSIDPSPWWANSSLEANTSLEERNTQ